MGVLWGFNSLILPFFSTYSLRFIVSWWMAWADNIIWKSQCHLPLRSDYGAAGRQGAVSSLSKHQEWVYASWSPGQLQAQEKRRLIPLGHCLLLHMWSGNPDKTQWKQVFHYLWWIHRYIQSHQGLSSIWGSQMPASAFPTEWGKSWTQARRESLVLGLAFLSSILPECRNTSDPSSTTQRWVSSLEIKEQFNWINLDPLMNSRRGVAQLPEMGGQWHDRKINIYLDHCVLWSSCLFVFNYLLVNDREYENASFLTLLPTVVKPFDFC